MMISPNCPDHKRLVLDLALGRLDDDVAAEAENISESCPVCRGWWQEQFEGGEAEVVDHAVATMFSDLQLPRRRRSHGWIAVAAAMVMALGVGTLWMARGPVSVEPISGDRTASIQRMDFEVPETVIEFTRVETPVADPDPAPIVPVMTQETVIAESVPSRTVSDGKSEPLFSGSFESGDLGGWVPKT